MQDRRRRRHGQVLAGRVVPCFPCQTAHAKLRIAPFRQGSLPALHLLCSCLTHALLAPAGSTQATVTPRSGFWFPPPTAHHFLPLLKQQLPPSCSTSISIKILHSNNSNILSHNLQGQSHFVSLSHEIDHLLCHISL